MANLIQYSDFAGYRDISSNIDSAKRIDPYIVEAQELDLRKFLGDIFYQEVIADLTASPQQYSVLLSGGTYSYGGYTYTFKGLKAALVFWTYARFLSNDDIKITPSGAKRKITNESEFVSEAALSRVVSNAREIAATYANQCNDYIARQSSTIYDHYIGKKRNTKSMRITAL
jgi:hypothetical protein